MYIKIKKRIEKFLTLLLYFMLIIYSTKVELCAWKIVFVIL